MYAQVSGGGGEIRPVNRRILIVITLSQSQPSQTEVSIPHPHPRLREGSLIGHGELGSSRDRQGAVGEGFLEELGKGTVRFKERTAQTTPS